MRVILQNRTVHERTRVALVCVADYDFFIGLLLRRDLPFGPCRESAAASAAQSGCLDDLNDILRLHLVQRLGKRRVAVEGNIFFDAFRIDPTAVLQCNTVLLGEEFLFVRRKQAFDDLAVFDMTLPDLVDVILRYLGVHRTLRLYN